MQTIYFRKSRTEIPVCPTVAQTYHLERTSRAAERSSGSGEAKRVTEFLAGQKTRPGELHKERAPEICRGSPQVKERPPLPLKKQKAQSSELTQCWKHFIFPAARVENVVHQEA